MVSKSPKRVVVITHTGDVHVPYVEKYFQSPFTIIDPAKIPLGIDLSFESDMKHQGVVLYNGERLDDIGAVWYRKPPKIAEMDIPVVEAHRTYSIDVLDRFVGLLRSAFDDAFWLSDFYAIIRTEKKSYQQVLAVRNGFLIPDNVITSSSEVVRDFYKKHEHVVVKTLAMGVNPNSKIAPYPLHPTVQVKFEDLNLSGLELAPAIFQEAIRAVADIRVTVVGDEVFAAEYRDKGLRGREAVRDHRITHLFRADTRHEVHILPDTLYKQCIELVKNCGLQFGAIDLVLDKDGRYWFLEINANGQWAFIEDETGQPIGRALADLLKCNI